MSKTPLKGLFIDCNGKTHSVTITLKEGESYEEGIMRLARTGKDILLTIRSIKYGSQETE